VENVLRFSRLGRDDASVATPVDITAETQRILDEFRSLAASRQTQVEAELEPTPPVPLRPDALQRMFLNLLDNAVKYGPAGQTVTVSVRAVDGEVRLAVTDEGPGVPANERESVWRPFERGSAAAIAAGSGIGLSIVRDVASQHGGRVWVESAPGGGACFVIALPVAASVVSVPRPDAATHTENGGARVRGEARRT
jgi:signal transduction histidine kinase